VASVTCNNRKKCFTLHGAQQSLDYPYCRCAPSPTPENPVSSAFMDPELAFSGFSYVLKDGSEGSILIDQVYDYNRDPDYIRNMLLYQLTIEARRHLKASRMGRREIIRLMGTSPAQLYRLLDQTNYTKSVDQMLRLLGVLHCQVRLEVLPESA